MDDKAEEWHRLQQQKSQSITQRNIESIDKVLEQDGQPKNE
jgi:hypothetical protein